MFQLYASVIFLVLAPNLISSQVSRNANDWDDYGSPPRNNYQHRKFFRADFNTFSYEEPEAWGYTYPTCNGRFQSPININIDNLEYRQIRRALKWHNLEKIPTRMNLEKSSIFVEMKPQWNAAGDIPYLTGGPLNESYYFYNFHFHWNIENDAGSEHAVNGKRFPMEVHAVYTSNPEGIITRNDRILVTAFMITITNNYNSGLDPIISAITKRAATADKDIPLRPLPLKQLGLTFCTDYVIYSGSLTTPPCTQGVTWVISSQPISISRNQYVQLKRALSAPGMSSSNNRPLQPLNDQDCQPQSQVGTSSTQGKRCFYITQSP